MMIDTLGMPLREVPELEVPLSASVRIAPDLRVPLPPDIAALVDHPIFQRLRGIRQLGFVDRVYPSATHSRFEHSLGVYYNAIGYAKTLWADPISSYFRETMRARELRSLFIAALCHDLGQYPFSHVLEDTERTDEGDLPTDSLFDHEAYTRQLLCDPAFGKSILHDCAADAPDFEEVLNKLGVSSHDVLAVLTGHDFAELTPGSPSMLHSIIDGPIDADKFDYLRRDAHHAGVTFGAAIDEHRFYQALTVIEEPRQQTAAPPNSSGTAAEVAVRRILAITSKGRVPAEQILMARWHMFTEVYWHRTTRAHEAILAAAVYRLRPHVDDFELWFRATALSPRTTDESFLQLLRQLAAGRSGDVRLKGSADSPILSSCRDLLDSLVCQGGRAQYKRLVSVSAVDDPDLYTNLQSLRRYQTKTGQAALDALAEEVVRRVANTFRVVVQPLELVFDVPARRSPANTVYLLGVSSPQRWNPVRLADRSRMWREFGEAFHDLTRKIRVFCPANIRARIRESGGGEEATQLKLYDVLRQSVLETARQAYQLDLFPGGPMRHRTH